MYSNIKIHTQFAQIIRNQILNKLKKNKFCGIYLLKWNYFNMNSFDYLRQICPNKFPN